MKNFKIYISCHKECYIPEKDFLFPIHVGAKNANKRFEYMLRDDIGDICLLQMKDLKPISLKI